MREEASSAGVSPAPLAASTGGEDNDPIERDVVPAAAMLRSGLGACRALIDTCVAMANDQDQTSNAKTHAASVAARLASASAQAASAIARLADAETRQRLADIKLQNAFIPKRRRAAPPPPRTFHDSYNPKDWENTETEGANLNFNSQEPR